MIAQPVCIEFDDIDRLWVVQHLPSAGASGAKANGTDRITILSDFDHYDHPRKVKDFVSGLNLVSGIAFGYRGVFVLQATNLLFYSDKNHHDIPDSDPEVVVSGFGMGTAPSSGNSLKWGPDGWLYGYQGGTVRANVRGIQFQGGIWRYQPVSKRFELFCEVEGKARGFDFDKDGNLICPSNLGRSRAMLAAQGGCYVSSFGKLGAVHDPRAYAYLDPLPQDNDGHVTVSGLVYQSDAFAEEFRDQYMHLDAPGHDILWSKIERKGAGITTTPGGELFAGSTTGFVPCDMTVGPDGALFIAGWNDNRIPHSEPGTAGEKNAARIYRLQSGPFKDLAFARSINTDLSFRTLLLENLVQLLGSRKDWFAVRARRILAEKHDETIYPVLRGNILNAPQDHLKLESFWALYGSGGADEAFLNDCLDHKSAPIRRWAVRFLGDRETISPMSEQRLLKLAEKESDMMTRSQLASTAQRLRPALGLQLAAKTVRDEDVNDPQIALLLWWAVEKHCVAAIQETLALFTTERAWRSPLVRERILPRLMRRYAAEGTEATLRACDKLLASAPVEKDKRQMLASLAQGLGEGPQANRSSKLEKLPPDLRERLGTLERPAAVSHPPPE